MKALNSTQIDKICKEIVKKSKIKHPNYYPHIYAMYITGCRIGEVFNSRLSINFQTNQIEIVAQKKNFIRAINIMPDHNFNLLCNLIDRQELTYLNIRGLQRVIMELMPISNIRCGEKGIGAHIFRHNYIRKLKDSGKDYEEIDRHLGYTNQKSKDTYLSAVIYY